MTTTNSSTGTLTGEIVLERIFNAPRELVFKAWSDPEQVTKWWGPAHFTAPVIKMDFRVGGKYHFCMHSPDGQDFWSTGVYKEIVAPERIVCTDSFADPEGNIVSGAYYGMDADAMPLELLVTLTFEQLPDGKTKMTLRHEGVAPGEMAEMTKAGWSTSFDKLDASLK